MKNLRNKDEFIDEIVLHFDLGLTTNEILKELQSIKNYQINGNEISTYYEKHHGNFKNKIVINIDLENNLIKLYKHKIDEEKCFDDEYSVIYQEDGENKIIKKHSVIKSKNKYGLTEEETEKTIHLKGEETQGKYEKIKNYIYDEDEKILKHSKETMEYKLPTNDRLCIINEQNRKSQELKILDEYGEVHTKRLTEEQAEEILKRSDDPYNLINYNPYYYKQKSVNPYRM